MSTAVLGDLSLVTADELAQAFSLKTSTIKEWARIGKIPSVRLSAKVVRFRPGEVEKALEAMNDAGKRDP